MPANGTSAVDRATDDLGEVAVSGLRRAFQDAWGCLMLVDVTDNETIRLLRRYLSVLELPTDCLRVTTDRATFGRWVGRRMSGGLGGAYAFLPRLGEHAVLINLPRIDRSRPRALEVVVAEELVHMRDWLDGDRRRHAKHGHDRIAHRVAALTGASLDEIRTCLVPVRRRPVRYVYACPACGLRVGRRVRGTWACGRCAPAFDPRFRLQLVDDLRCNGGSTHGRRRC